MCSYLTGAGAQAAPSCPRPPPLRKFGKDGRANGRSLPLRGKHDAGAGAPLEIAANVAGNLNVFFRVQRFWIFRLQLKEKVGADATALEPGGSSCGRCAIRARAGTVRAAGASRHRAARAREVWVMESELSARAAGKLVAALLEKRKPRKLSGLKRKGQSALEWPLACCATKGSRIFKMCCC